MAGGEDLPVYPLLARMTLVLSAILWLGLPAFARAKTDVLVMKNGDRITCEVKRLDGGVLSADLDYVDGTLSIDWQKVARIESTAMFTVQLQDGSTYAGKLITPESLAGTPVKLEIQQLDAVEPISVTQDEVVRVTQTSNNFLHRFNGGVTLGSVYSKGNNTKQYNVGSDLEYQETRWAGRVRYNSNLSSSTGADTATRNQVDLGGYHLLSRKNFFYTGSAGYLQSSVQGIQSQINLAAGVGIFLKNTNRVRLTLLGAPGWQRTNYSDPTADQRVQNIAVFLVSSNLELFQFKKTRLSAVLNVLPALTDPGRVFTRTNLTYYLKLFGKFDWNLSFYGNWDTRPPAQLSGTDYGTSTGLSYSFGNR
jgi:putative salt-induced outer membrane protein YdiY